MKNKKLFAILTLLCFMFTLMPVAAFADGAVSTQTELNAAIDVADGATTIELNDGTYKLLVKNDEECPNIVDKNITFKGSKGVVFDLTGIVGATWHTQDTGATITFDGVTVKWNEDNEGYQGFANAKKVVYKNCSIYGTQFMGGDADFINCVFEAENTAEKGYAVYGRGSGTLTFTDCNFKTDGRAIMLYQDQTTEVNVVMNNCTFSDNGNYTSKDKAVVETGDGQYQTSKFNITFTDCNITKGFETNNSTSPLWGNKDNIPTDRLTVAIIDNTLTATPPTVDETSGTISTGISGSYSPDQTVENGDDSALEGITEQKVTVNVTSDTEESVETVAAVVTVAQETASSMADNAALEIVADAATVTFDETALGAAAEAAETAENTNIVITIAANNEVAVSVENEEVKAMAAVDITFKVNGDTVLTEGNDKEAIITVAAVTTMDPGAEAYVYYMNNGEATEGQRVIVDENRIVKFETNHTSTYAIFATKVAPLADEETTPDTPSTSTSTGGGFSGTYNYPVTAGDVDGAKVTFSDNNAVAGETVTITVTPDSGKQVDEVIVTDADGDIIPVTKTGDNTYTFTMPAGKVNVAVTTEAIDYDNKIVLQIGNQNVVVDGKASRNDVAPVIQGDRTLVPIRVIVEALGGDVDWNEATRTVTITIDGKVLKLVIDQPIAGFGQGATIMDSRTYVPVRYVAEYVGANVEWIAETQQIVILK